MARFLKMLPTGNTCLFVLILTPESSTCRLRLKCDGTRAETRFRLSAKRASPFKSAGAWVQSTTCSRGVRISGSNAGYTMFRGSVKSTGYKLHSPVSPSLPLPCVTVCHHVSTGLYRNIHDWTARTVSGEVAEEFRIRHEAYFCVALDYCSFTNILLLSHFGNSNLCAEYKVHTPINALFIKLDKVLQFTLKITLTFDLLLHFFF